MASFQKTYLLGNVTKDVELKYLQTGTVVADLSIAVNRTWKGDNGEKHEETTFFDCTAWGRTAEIASEFLRRGSPVFCSGQFQNQSWTDKATGKKRSKLVGRRKPSITWHPPTQSARDSEAICSTKPGSTKAGTEHTERESKQAS